MDVQAALSQGGRSLYLSERIGRGVQELLRGDIEVVLSYGYVHSLFLPDIKV